jgi:hypothetical protein
VKDNLTRGNSMKNEELMCRHGSRLNDFTRALRDACKTNPTVRVTLRNSMTCAVRYAAPEEEHPYDDCPHGGFRTADGGRYWLANGESITGDQFDIVQFEELTTPAARSADASLDADTLKRLRRILRLLGLESTVPEDDAGLSGSLFSVFGSIAGAIERRDQKTATTAVSETEVHAPTANAVASYIADQWTGCIYDELDIGREILNAGEAFLRNRKKA